MMPTTNLPLQCSAHCTAQLESVSCLALRLLFGILMVSLLLVAVVGGFKEGAMLGGYKEGAVVGGYKEEALVGGYKEGAEEGFRLAQDGGDEEDLQVQNTEYR